MDLKRLATNLRTARQLQLTAPPVPRERAPKHEDDGLVLLAIDLPEEESLKYHLPVDERVYLAGTGDYTPDIEQAWAMDRSHAENIKQTDPEHRAYMTIISANGMGRSGQAEPWFDDPTGRMPEIQPRLNEDSTGLRG